MKSRFTSSRLCPGFTLVEVMAVIVIILILAGLVLRMAGPASGVADRSAAQGTLIRIANALESYKAQNGKYPDPPLTCHAAGNLFGYLEVKMSGSTVSDSIVRSDGVLLDPWSNPIQYQFNSANDATYRLWSMGPNGRSGNATERADDINPPS